ncbi:hypothetical protein HDV00_009535 [Rhizophlyctis rosea]|nr:hypothetical protein HDV00_009535 [Rhizophlyctis rosea]
MEGKTLINRYHHVPRIITKARTSKDFASLLTAIKEAERIKDPFTVNEPILMFDLGAGTADSEVAILRDTVKGRKVKVEDIHSIPLGGTALFDQLDTQFEDHKTSFDLTRIPEDGYIAFGWPRGLELAARPHGTCPNLTGLGENGRLLNPISTLREEMFDPVVAPIADYILSVVARRHIKDIAISGGFPT